MEPKWLWVPVLSLGAAAPASATIYLSVDQAQALMFPGATLQAQFRTLTAAQIQAIEKDCGVPVPYPTLQVWRASSGGWFILDQVIGKHAPIRYAVALDQHGAVRDVEILEYMESYGGEIRLAAWRRQFRGKRDEDHVDLDRNIRNISGATLSCTHVTDGIRRILATYAVVLSHD